MTSSNYYLLIRIYSLLKRKKRIFTFKSLRTLEGWCDNEFICINLKGNDSCISTTLHECLHYLYPNWSEQQVIRKESAIYHQMSIRQTKWLYKLLVKVM